MKECVKCGQMIEDEDHFIGESLGEYWCHPCGIEERENENG